MCLPRFSSHVLHGALSSSDLRPAQGWAEGAQLQGVELDLHSPGPAPAVAAGKVTQSSSRMSMAFHSSQSSCSSVYQSAGAECICAYPPQTEIDYWRLRD